MDLEATADTARTDRAFADFLDTVEDAAPASRRRPPAARESPVADRNVTGHLVVVVTRRAFPRQSSPMPSRDQHEARGIRVISQAAERDEELVRGFSSSTATPR